MKKTITGKVIQGHGLGTKLGFPTANIFTGIEILSKDWGVYICYTYISKKKFPSAK